MKLRKEVVGDEQLNLEFNIKLFRASLANGGISKRDNEHAAGSPS
jgi:hypothetical protein